MSLRAPRVSSVVPPPLSQDDVVVLGFLKKAMEETGWTYEALIAELKRVNVRVVDRQYMGKMLNGEKPISLRQIIALPDDLECAFLKRWIEYRGCLVVTPVTEAEARRQLATGLYSLLTTRSLPDKAGVTAKAGLR